MRGGPLPVDSSRDSATGPAVSQARSRTITTRARYLILERDGFRCAYCGRTAEAEQLHVDHIVPYSRGGATTWDNLIAACIPCNLAKRDGLLPSDLEARVLSEVKRRNANSKISAMPFEVPTRPAYSSREKLSVGASVAEKTVGGTSRTRGDDTPVVRTFPVNFVPDRWLTQAALLMYLGIGKRTLHARQKSGAFKPHGRDKCSGKPLWKQSMIDSELVAARNDVSILRDKVFPRNEKYIQNLQRHADQH